MNFSIHLSTINLFICTYLYLLSPLVLFPSILLTQFRCFSPLNSMLLRILVSLTYATINVPEVAIQINFIEQNCILG